MRPIPRDWNDTFTGVAAMLMAVDKKSLVNEHRHGNNDVIWKPEILCYSRFSWWKIFLVRKWDLQQNMLVNEIMTYPSLPSKNDIFNSKSDFSLLFTWRNITTNIITGLWNFVKVDLIKYIFHRTGRCETQQLNL